VPPEVLPVGAMEPDMPAPSPATVPLVGWPPLAVPDDPVVADPPLMPVGAGVPLAAPGGLGDPQPAKERPTTRAAILHFENARMNCSSTCFGRSKSSARVVRDS
jgi:hypothetical protein